MKTIAGSALVLCATVCLAATAAAQMGGWAVDATAGVVRPAAFWECGAGCSVVLTFERCAAAYAVGPGCGQVRGG